MAIIYHRTKNMFEMSQIVGFFINPTNLLGSMDRGISLEFIKRFPHLRDIYVKAVENKTLAIGKLQIIKKKDLSYAAINLPTKNHFADWLSEDDLIKALGCVRERFLNSNKNIHIVTPLLGQDFSEEIDFSENVTLTDGKETKYGKYMNLFNEMFEDVSPTVHVCISPDKTNILPRYLVLYANDLNKVSDDVDKYVKELLKTYLYKWGLTYSDFDKILTVSEDENINVLFKKHIPEIYHDKMVEYDTSVARIAPYHFRSLLLSYVGTHFIIVDTISQKLSSHMEIMYKTIKHMNNTKEIKSIDLKQVSNTFYLGKIK